MREGDRDWKERNNIFSIYRQNDCLNKKSPQKTAKLLELANESSHVGRCKINRPKKKQANFYIIIRNIGESKSKTRCYLLLPQRKLNTYAKYSNICMENVSGDLQNVDERSQRRSK